MTKNSNTFLEYLGTDRFYDKIHGSVFSWCLSNKELLLNKINGYDVKRITNVEEIELDYKNVWIDSKEGTRIDFDIAIEITVEVEGIAGKHNDRDSYTSRLWVNVYCTGSLDKKLNDFRIIGVEEFYKSKPTKPLSGDFVPLMKKSEYDDYANEILEKYYFKFHPKAKTNPVAIDIEELAKNMGLNIITTSISKDKNIFGQIFFSDVEIELYNEAKLKYEKTKISKNTILVDNKAAYLRSFGSRNMTIAHECVHAYYHRKTFLFAQMFSKDLQYIECQIDGTMKNSKSNTSAEWMEIQANGLAPYLLMPRESFEKHAINLLKRHYHSNEIGSNDINLVIDELASTYGVTIYAARKRLIDLGFEEAVGAYNWIDGRYVRPYTFKKGSLAYNETFTISYKDVYRKILSDVKIASLILHNQYVFVENHLCLNHPNFIEKNKNGDLILTYYALNHMDECCVKFKYKTIKGFSGDSNLGIMSYLSRDVSKELEFDLEISSTPNFQEQDNLFKERYKIHNENVGEVLKAIAGMNFGQIVEYLMNYLDIRINELEDESGISERTIRRYIKGENINPTKRSVVAILRALNIPPRICDYAFKQSGLTFRQGHAEDDALLIVMVNLRGASVQNVNNFLESVGFEPISKNE